MSRIHKCAYRDIHPPPGSLSLTRRGNATEDELPSIVITGNGGAPVLKQWDVSWVIGRRVDSVQKQVRDFTHHRASSCEKGGASSGQTRHSMSFSPASLCQSLRNTVTSADFSWFPPARSFFAATGIIDGSLLSGVKYHGNEARTKSPVLRCETGSRRVIHAEHVLFE